MYKIDGERKVTVSLGGVCSLGCRHCYTTTSQFIHAPSRHVEDVILDLQFIKSLFDVICISGDTDCFLDPHKGIELIDSCVESFPEKVVMFTTRLIPQREDVKKLLAINERACSRSQLLIACISVVTYSWPNILERDEKVPSSKLRIEFLNELSDYGIPTIITMRPTFPFNIVSKHEIDEIIGASVKAACALGEVFILDEMGQLEKRLGINVTHDHYKYAPMSFLKQTSNWRKQLLFEEFTYTRNTALSFGIPYFLRSISAIRMLQEYWDFNGGKCKITCSLESLSDEVDVYP